jgi:hypothetical protein
MILCSRFSPPDFPAFIIYLDPKHGNYSRLLELQGGSSSYRESLQESMEFYIDKHENYPGFLARVTLEQCKHLAQQHE